MIETNSIFYHIILFLIGISPCILWLLFYLRQDVHPESNSKVLEIFILGLLCVPLIAKLEEIAGSFLAKNLPHFFLIDYTQKILSLQTFFYYIFIIGFIEEIFKYLIVRIRVIRSSHFDEPIDAMLYLIIASLGIAAGENVGSIIKTVHFNEAIYLSILRLLTAIFLHTLTAAIIGFFLALSLRFKKIKRISIVSLGLIIAIVFHALYDISLVKIEYTSSIFDFFIPIGIIALMAIIVYFFLIKVKKMPRSCKI